ncbi:hypothetical protein [Cryptosporangium sp. NPDC051539]|uniref:hypothetical protein n=1 Tax=Cryptosporangium sp. NPDC051539 TaxID=3363962 RepID=UPI00379D4713
MLAVAAEAVAMWPPAITAEVITVVGVAITGVFAFLSSLQARRGAEASALATARATTFVPTSDRFASWQMAKREWYEQLLAAVREYEGRPDDEGLRSAAAHAFDVALLAAGKDLRPRLWEYRTRTLVETSQSSSRWRNEKELVTAMAHDIEFGQKVIKKATFRARLLRKLRIDRP